MQADGCIPEHWTWSTIGQACELNPRRDSLNGHEADTTVTFVPMPAVDATSGTISSPQVRPLSEVRKGYTAFKQGDVIMAKITPCMENGKAAIVRELENGLGFGSTEFHVLRPNGVATAEYLYHYIRQQSFRRAAEAEMTGSVGQRRVPADFLRDAPIPIPPIEEQQRIAAKLDDLLGRVAATRERLNRVPAILRRFRQSVLAAAVSGRLSNNPAHDGDLPSGWTSSPFGVLVENYDGRRIPVKADDRKKRLGPYPYYGASGVIDHIDAFLFDGDYLLVSEDGANLLARSTPIAFMASGQFWVNNHAHVVRAKDDVDPVYLQHFINGLDVQEYVTGSAQPKLTQAALNRIPVPLPPLREQQQIVQTADSLLALADATEGHHDTGASRAGRIAESLLARAFSGGL